MAEKQHEFYDYFSGGDNPNKRMKALKEKLKTIRPVINSLMIHEIQKDVVYTNERVDYAEYQHIFEIVRVVKL